ncbi:MAG: flagellar hook-basal body complex protein FliE [Alphaproteobacteria bacterium]|nr:flagellar hook-basal body complex protein FliE [Alphaproteobacteria bacterium]
MDINAFSAARTYGAALKALKPDAPKKQMGSPAGDNPSAQFNPAKVVDDLAHTVAKSEQTASEFMVGKADPHSVVEALASAELAVETAVTVRDKVVEAYQELMRMPV